MKKYMCIQIAPAWPEISKILGYPYPHIGEEVTGTPGECLCGCNDRLLYLVEYNNMGYSARCFAELSSDIDETELVANREEVAV